MTKGADALGAHRVITSEDNAKRKEKSQILHIVCKEEKKATYPFYYYYTEVWKDWFEKR